MVSIAGVRAPADTPLRIAQGADWAGIQIPIFDAAGVIRTSLAGCTATGSIRNRPHVDPALFVWSTSPAAGQGLITFAAGYMVVSVTGTQSALWAFRIARWQIDLVDPSAPVGQQKIRAGQGPLIVDPSYL